MPRQRKSPELRPIDGGLHHNDISDEQKASLFVRGVEKLETLIKRKDEAVAAIRLQRKTMKSEGFSAEELNYATWLRKQEGEEPRERVELQIRVAAWLARPIGLQAEMFA